MADASSLEVYVSPTLSHNFRSNLFVVASVALGIRIHPLPEAVTSLHFLNVVMRSATLWRDKFSLLLGLAKGNKSASLARVYSEMPYRALINRESKRSERSGYFCRILLVYCTDKQGLVVPFEAEPVDKTILVLSSNSRDTDYIGWYRQDHIMGVLLTTIRRDSIVNGCEDIKARFEPSIRGALTVRDDHSLHICLLKPDELGAFTVSDQPAPSPDSTESIL